MLYYVTLYCIAFHFIIFCYIEFYCISSYFENSIFYYIIVFSIAMLYNMTVCACTVYTGYLIHGKKTVCHKCQLIHFIYIYIIYIIYHISHIYISTQLGELVPHFPSKSLKENQKISHHPRFFNLRRSWTPKSEVQALTAY